MADSKDFKDYLAQAAPPMEMEEEVTEEVMPEGEAPMSDDELFATRVR